MHPIRQHLLSALAATFTLLAVAPLHSAAPSKSQQLTSPDQVPEGLAKSDWSSIRAAYEAGRHAFQPVEGQDGHWQARNPGQHWTTQFDGRGFIAQPKGADWQWGLELQSYGFGDQQTPIQGKPAVKAEGQRLSYQWDANVQEWFVNDQRGLEHGFTIGQRPESAPPHNSQPPTLNFLLTTRGGLTPRITAGSVQFQDATGTTVLNYAGLKVWDADGTILPARFEPAGLHGFRILVDDEAARYPITIDPIAQQAYLKASNTGADDNFGYSVAVSGDTAVIGAQAEDSSTTGVNSTPDELASGSGAAYVFTRTAGSWTQQAYLKASNTGASDYFGISVAVSGDTAVIGAVSESSSTTGVGGNQADNSAAVSGAAYVFTRSGTTWSQQAYLKASNTGVFDQFGYSVAVSGDTAVIGAFAEDSSTAGVNSTPNEDALGSGAAYVFTRSGSTWTQQAYLKASNTEANDVFGISVAVSGDTAVIAAPREASNATGVGGNQADNSAAFSGAAYVFTRSGTAWSQQAYLKASNTEASDQFGFSVAVSGDTAVIGAFLEDSNANGVNSSPDDSGGVNFDSGAAYTFSGLGPVVSAPTVTSITPTSGSTLGGTSVTITGTNLTGATGVTIGGAAATSVVVVDATSLTCNTPTGSAGTASVLVTTPNGTNVANTLYTYVAPPTVTSISPSTGSTAGGTPVTITGTNFTGATSVTIGGVAVAAFTVVDGTHITTTLPTGIVGVANVVVTGVGGTATGTGIFTFVDSRLIVTTNSDVIDNADNVVSLREALAYAATLVGQQTISFGDGSANGGTNFTDATPDTITLTTIGDGTAGPSAFGITSAVTIQGNASTAIILAGGGGASNLRAFYIASSGSLTLRSLTLSGFRHKGGDGERNGGGAAGLGGAIFNNGGALVILGSTFSSNIAQGGSGFYFEVYYGAGGGLGGMGVGSDGGGPNGGTLASPNGGFGGGGAQGSNWSSYIEGGKGGFGGGGGMGFRGSFSGFGGGTLIPDIWYGSGGGVSGSAGGFGGGAGGVPDPDIHGGGIGITNGYGGGGMGGAVFSNGGTTTVTNSTFASNAASGGYGLGNGFGYGGALFSRNGTVTLLNCTISANAAQGGRGVYVLADTSDGGNNTSPGSGIMVATVNNTIIGSGDTGAADFVAGTNPYSPGGTVTTSGTGNLIRTATGFSGTVISTADPLLAPLAYNGGPTPTLALLPGSPAIDTGDATAAASLTTDQRGTGFARSVVSVDIGAFESRGFTLSISGGDNQKARPNATFSNPLSIAISSAFGEPVNGGRVTFTAPGSGASATMTTNPATISGGTASVTAQANTTLGDYNVTASASGSTPSPVFALTNAVPEIAISGNSIDIPGDASNVPALADHTDFGGTAVPVVRTFTIVNSGNNALILSGTPKVSLSNNSEFSVNLQPTSPVPELIGSTTFSITFTPLIAGIKTSTVSITNDDPNEGSFVFNIRGAGVFNDPPVITSNGGGASASINIPENTTAVTTVTATDADLPAQVLMYSKSGPDAGLFNIGSSTGVLTFITAPNFEGPHGNTYLLTVIATDNGSPILSDSQELSITISDVNETEIVVEQPAATGLVDGSISPVQFGTADIAAPVPLTFTIRNTGEGLMSIGAIVFDGTNPGDFSVITAPAVSLGTAGSTTFVVTFTPQQAGVRSAVMHIANDDSNENPFDITLTGTGNNTIGSAFDGTTPMITVSTGDFVTTGLNFGTTLGFQPAPGSVYTFINIVGSGNGIVGTFNDLPDGGVVAMAFNGVIYYFQVDYAGATGNDLTLTSFTPAATPAWRWTAGPNKRNNAANFGALNVAAATNNPGGRQGAMNWRGTDGSLWMFGGYGYATAVTNPPNGLNDLWQYNRTLNKAATRRGRSMSS